MRIALFTTATGNYVEFIQPLLESAKKYFLPHDYVTFVVFTDRADDLKYLYNKYDDRLILVPILPAKFPHASMIRCKHYAKFMANNKAAKDFDYCYAIDADALFVDTVDQTIKSEKVAVKHCAQSFLLNSFEPNDKSACYILKENQNKYFGGGFYGGEAFWFYFINNQMNQLIEADAKNDITPIWHDETALNKVFSIYAPTKILLPSYHYPGWDSPLKCNPYIQQIWDKNKVDYDPIIVFLEKTYKNKGVEFYRS